MNVELSKQEIDTILYEMYRGYPMLPSNKIAAHEQLIEKLLALVAE